VRRAALPCDRPVREEKRREEKKRKEKKRKEKKRKEKKKEGERKRCGHKFKKLLTVLNKQTSFQLQKTKHGRKNVKKIEFQ
jgi:hypothetical protein